jgi:hypothetical protein
MRDWAVAGKNVRRAGIRVSAPLYLNEQLEQGTYREQYTWRMVWLRGINQLALSLFPLCLSGKRKTTAILARDAAQTLLAYLDLAGDPHSQHRLGLRSSPAGVSRPQSHGDVQPSAPHGARKKVDVGGEESLVRALPHPDDHGRQLARLALEWLPCRVLVLHVPLQALQRPDGRQRGRETSRILMNAQWGPRSSIGCTLQGMVEAKGRSRNEERK